MSVLLNSPLQILPKHVGWVKTLFFAVVKKNHTFYFSTILLCIYLYALGQCLFHYPAAPQASGYCLLQSYNVISFFFDCLNTSRMSVPEVAEQSQTFHVSQ